MVAEQWADALHSWLGITDQHIHIVHTSADCRFRALQPKFVITSYNFLGKLKEDIETRDYRIVVVDESHYIKDWKVHLPVSIHTPSFLVSISSHIHQVASCKYLIPTQSGICMAGIGSLLLHSSCNGDSHKAGWSYKPIQNITLVDITSWVKPPVNWP